MCTKLFSPAKINLYLHVLKKRSDGYHDLSSLFQAIDLGDVLHFEWPSSGPDRLTCTDTSLPTDSSNLIMKAVALFRKKTGWNEPVNIHTEKYIPMQSGLGGGSSNAATTLWALNEKAARPASLQELQTWSAEIGSDIPFFFSQGTALCQGRGEEVHPLPQPPPSAPFWIIKPPFGLSTPAVFSHLKVKSSFHKEQYRNDLEEPSFELKPELLSIKQDLLAAGFNQVMMTGSGSALICSGEAHLPVLAPLTSFFRVNYLNRESNAWYQKTSS